MLTYIQWLKADLHNLGNPLDQQRIKKALTDEAINSNAIIASYKERQITSWVCHPDVIAHEEEIITAVMNILYPNTK